MIAAIYARKSTEPEGAMMARYLLRKEGHHGSQTD